MTVSQDQKDRMLSKAVRQYGSEIVPAGTAMSWEECYTECEITKTVTFWFNVPTEVGMKCHVIVESVK